MANIEYRVRPVARFHVTRFSQTEGTIGSESLGEFDNQQSAYDVAYALCRAEHQRLGYPPGDERIKYPDPFDAALAVSIQTT